MAKAVEIQDFSYHYPDGTSALDNVSLSVEEGQRVVLIGPNGAGKSTLLLTMAGFVKGSGKIFVDGLEAEQVRARVDDALRVVGLGGMGDRAPHHLSAGQKRAAAIATVLSMSPKIITFDEPDGNLDPANRNNLIKILEGLSQTLIIATCNMNFAAVVADRAVLIDKGKVIADGNVKELMSNSELMVGHGLEVPRAI